MNNAKIWLVVKPTVGIPLFLGAVAGTSLFVHYNLLKNTTWLPTYYQGKPKKAAALDVPATGTQATVVFRNDESAAGGSQEGLVVLPDGRTGKVVFTDGGGKTTLASSSTTVTK
jgi:light-harvesting protein B-800-850 alpha chain